MKIRRGFVTNSSSSSFILSAQNGNISDEYIIDYINNYNKKVLDIFDKAIKYVMKQKQKGKASKISFGCGNKELNTYEDYKSKYIRVLSSAAHIPSPQEERELIRLINELNLTYSSMDEYQQIDSLEGLKLYRLHDIFDKKESTAQVSSFDAQVDAADQELSYDLEEVFEWYSYCDYIDEIVHTMQDSYGEEVDITSLTGQDAVHATSIIRKGITAMKACSKDKGQCKWCTRCECAYKTLSIATNNELDQVTNKDYQMIADLKNDYKTQLLALGDLIIFNDDSLPDYLAVPLSQLARHWCNHMG